MSDVQWERAIARLVLNSIALYAYPNDPRGREERDADARIVSHLEPNSCVTSPNGQHVWSDLYTPFGNEAKSTCKICRSERHGVVYWDEVKR